MTDGRCELRLTRRYEAPPAEVWAAVVDLDRWLAPPPGVAVARTEPERVLELDWRPPGEEPSVVRLELAPDGDGGTRLVVDHRRIEATLGMRYMRVWTSRLELVA